MAQGLETGNIRYRDSHRNVLFITVTSIHHLPPSAVLLLFISGIVFWLPFVATANIETQILTVTTQPCPLLTFCVLFLTMANVRQFSRNLKIITNEFMSLLPFTAEIQKRQMTWNYRTMNSLYKTYDEMSEKIEKGTASAKHIAVMLLGRSILLLHPHV